MGGERAMRPVLGIVPARAGSKRLPRKNVRELGGKPLVGWAIEVALGSRWLDHVVVSSDDPEALDIARGYPEVVALERPSELASDTAPAIAYVEHALSELEARGEGPFETVVILQPSSPLTLPEDVDSTLELLAASGAESAVTVVKLDHAVHPAKLKRLDGDRLIPYLEEERGRMAEHELPEVYVRNCAVYATRRAAIDRGSIVTGDCRAHVMPRQRSIDINDATDFAFAEFLLARTQISR